MITDDMAEAVEGAKLILVCIPSVAHEVFFEKLAPLLKDGMIVHIIPDNYGSLRLRKHLRAIGNDADVIIGACGFFAHFQEDVKEAVKVPVYLSSLCQLPSIKVGLRAGQKVAVVAASGESVTEEMLKSVEGSLDDIEVFDVGSMESFGAIRWGRTELDNGKLTEDLMTLGKMIRDEHPEIGAILLECSDLPPYAWAVQKASGLPVFDFISLINWVKASVVQKPYFGLI